MLKGIGDGEPIASDRFMVGGHEWVLLFYPDGKRSMSDGNAPNQPQDDPYAALFVALIGEGQRPLGVVQSGQGRVVRAFHRFTLVDQSGNGRHITKGRQREQGAVKISCARQDPQARNCHGYRKFVRRSVLEASGSGYLVDDVVVIRYEIELVVTSGGALNKSAKLLPAASVNVPMSEYITPQLDRITPYYTGLFEGEPLPKDGALELDETKPGFGLTLVRDGLHRPYARDRDWSRLNAAANLHFKEVEPPRMRL